MDYPESYATTLCYRELQVTAQGVWGTARRVVLLELGKRSGREGLQGREGGRSRYVTYGLKGDYNHFMSPRNSWLLFWKHPLFATAQCGGETEGCEGVAFLITKIDYLTRQRGHIPPAVFRHTVQLSREAVSRSSLLLSQKELEAAVDI